MPADVLVVKGQCLQALFDSLCFGRSSLCESVDTALGRGCDATDHRYRMAARWNLLISVILEKHEPHLSSRPQTGRRETSQKE